MLTSSIIKLTCQQLRLFPLLMCSIHTMNPLERSCGLNDKAEGVGVVCTDEVKGG